MAGTVGADGGLWHAEDPIVQLTGVRGRTGQGVPQLHASAAEAADAEGLRARLLHLGHRLTELLQRLWWWPHPGLLEQLLVVEDTRHALCCGQGVQLAAVEPLSTLVQGEGAKARRRKVLAPVIGSGIGLQIEDQPRG